MRLESRFDTRDSTGDGLLAFSIGGSPMVGLAVHEAGAACAALVDLEDFEDFLDWGELMVEAIKEEMKHVRPE